MTEFPDMSVEIDRRTRACWMRIRQYPRELYDQPNVALSLKTRKVKAKVIEVFLYGCSRWNLRQEHYAKLRTVHRRVDGLVQPCPLDNLVREHRDNIAHKTFVGGDAHPNERRAAAKANRVRKP